MNEKAYTSTRLREEISISDIVTVHYFEFSKDYSFGGEEHGFWELVYVDRGEVSAVSQTSNIKLKSGEIFFHRPNEWHSLKADGVNASAVIIISFYCNSAAMKSLPAAALHVGDRGRALLSEIISETKNAFDSPLSNLVTPRLKRKNNQPFGAEQLIKLNLCKLIISLLREGSAPASAVTKHNSDIGLFGELTKYLASNLDKKLSLEGIAHHAGISKTALKQLFKENAGCGACEYFIRLKIERAKIYIRESNYNFTQIAEMLGYNSVHYFSTQFKQIINMSPTEYASSIHALTTEAEQFSLK